MEYIYIWVPENIDHVIKLLKIVKQNMYQLMKKNNSDEIIKLFQFPKILEK